MPAPLDPPALAPKQDRSRRTVQRLLAAALELLGEKTFEEMTVEDIRKRAGLSAGGFYARFENKDDVLAHLNDGVFGAIVRSVREAFAPEACAGASAREIVRRYVALAVDAFREHRIVLRQVALRSRTSNDAGFRERVLQANRALHGIFRERLVERLDELGHPEPRVAIDVALTAVSGAMREYVLFQDVRPHFDPLPDERLVSELVDLFCVYLRTP